MGGWGNSCSNPALPFSRLIFRRCLSNQTWKLRAGSAATGWPAVLFFTHPPPPCCRQKAVLKRYLHALIYTLVLTLEAPPPSSLLLTRCYFGPQFFVLEPQVSTRKSKGFRMRFLSPILHCSSRSLAAAAGELAPLLRTFHSYTYRQTLFFSSSPFFS